MISSYIFRDITRIFKKYSTSAKLPNEGKKNLAGEHDLRLCGIRGVTEGKERK